MSEFGAAASSAGSWNRAYGAALLNALVFLLLSSVAAGLELGSTTANCVTAGIFFVGATLTGLMLLRAGEGVVAIGLFLIGAGVLFGFGTVYGALVPPDFVTIKFFSGDRKDRLLPMINLVNAVSVLLVLLAAWPMIGARRRAAEGAERLIARLGELARLLPLFVGGSVLIVGLQILTFPGPENLLLRGALGTVHRLPLAVILLAFALWGRQGPLLRFSVVGVVVVMTALGVLSTSKLNTLLPLAAMLGGLWLNPRARPVAVIGALVCAVAYFTVLAPLNTAARAYAFGAQEAGSLSFSVESVREGARDTREGQAEHDFLSRFTAAPYQAYLIGQRLDGDRGHSLDDAWTSLIPRALWPEKPNITRFGGELYSEITLRRPTSQLAPTYSAEAFWNYGWAGLAAISVLIGLELGWLTRRWLDLASGRSRSPAILIFCAPAAFLAFWVESWIATAYLGGFITLFLLIKAVDWSHATLRALRPLPRAAAPRASAPS